jgi:hypothetical protein
MCATVSFRDVRRNRYGGTADLACQAVSLFSWEVSGESVGMKRYLDSLLPNNKLAMV